MSNYLLAFIVNKKTFLTTIKGKEDEEAIPFDSFFDGYLSKDILKINQEGYTKENLRTFIKKSLANEEFAFNDEMGNHCIFKIVQVDGSSFEIEFKKTDESEKNEISYDYLTKVHSRNYFYDETEKELLKGGNENAYLIMFDLDNFKTINDTHGHLVGDICLKTIANKLNDIFKDYIFGRYGGDEFIAFVKDVSDEKLDELITESLKIRFAQNDKITAKGTISCSLGISGKVGDRKSISVLIEEADKALYKSKNHGKNTAIKDDGTIIYGGNQKQKKKAKLNKGESSLIFREEIAKKRKFQFGYLILIIAIFSVAITAMDLLFNKQAIDQTKNTAADLMKEQSALVALKITDDSKDIFSRMESSKQMLNEVKGSDETSLLNNMIDTLAKNTLLESPGLLLENGDIYFGDGKKYNVSSYSLANKIIVQDQRAVERISFLGEEDKIVIADPYTRRMTFYGSDNLTIVGITSMFTASRYSSLMLNSFQEDYYSAIIDSNASKICDTTSSNIKLFSNYGNIRNYFLENDSSEKLEQFNNVIEDNGFDIDIVSLNNENYFIYSSPTSLSDWSVLILVKYDTIYQTFASIVTTNAISVNALSIAFLLFVIILFVYSAKLRLEVYSRKYIDPLTRSINQQRFINDANVLIDREDGQRYLVYLNIRRFKLVNTALGKKNADDFLTKMSQYFESKLKNNELLSREYSDRFIMLLEEKDDESVKERLSKIAEEALASESLNENSRISFDIGVFRFDFKSENKTPIWLAIDRARKASGQASRGGNTYDIKFFSGKMLEDEQLEIYIEQSQELALQEGRFEVYYQGKYDLHEKTFEGCEALVRWKDERRGFINTQKFIDTFERNGFIKKLDIYIFEKVVKDVREMIDSENTPLVVSVNLSRKHFENPSFFDEYEKVVNKYDIPWKYLEFEITESIILNNEYALDSLIDRIHELGSKVSIDDFGSGFSNFAMINHVNYDVLKIDRKLLFGKDGKFDQSSKNVLQSVASLNKNMHKVTLCEGVEHQDESDYLESIGCDIIQGYFYARPMPKEDFIKLIEKSNSK